MLRQSFRRSVRRLQGAAVESRGNKSGPPPDYAHVIIETARHSNVGTGNNNDTTEEVYVEPHDAIILEMRPTSKPINIDSGSEIYTAMSEISINVCDTSDRDAGEGNIVTLDVTEASDEAMDCERARSCAEMEAVN